MIQLFENINCVKYEYETVQRTWKERLWSWPWKPWKKTKVITHAIPQAYRIKDTVVAHPIIAQQIRDAIKLMEERPLLAVAAAPPEDPCPFCAKHDGGHYIWCPWAGRSL